VTLLLHRSRLLFGLLFEDGAADTIYSSERSPADSNATFTQLIPKIIHQTYKDHDIPPRWRAGQQAVKDLHPDWEYMFWTDTSALSFITSHYPAHLHAFTSYKYPIQRVDALRYFLLHHYGGIYLDLDISPSRPLDPLLSYPAFACRTKPTGISNDALGSVPQHQFWGHVIDSLDAYNRNWLVSYITVMYSTGPLFLSVIWVEYLSALRSKSANSRGAIEMDRVRLLVNDDEKPGGDSYGYFYNVMGGSWHGPDVDAVFWMGRHWVVVTILGFVLGFGVTGVLWWTLKWMVGWWEIMRVRWQNNDRAAYLRKESLWV